MRNDNQITVTIQTGRGSQDFTFPKQVKIAEVISQAAAALGYPPQGNYALLRALDNQVLAEDRPLVSYHIEDGEVLVLSETGSGV